jgi:hypothetical protein
MTRTVLSGGRVFDGTGSDPATTREVARPGSTIRPCPDAPIQPESRPPDARPRSPA